MKNFVAKGHTITVVAPEAVLSGQLVLVGAMAGVAACDAAAGASVELSVEGVFDLAKTPADSMTQGAVAKALIATGVIDSGG
ncbi:MAG: capsid cement protein, partial [Bryobacteraceae bacterium]